MSALSPAPVLNHPRRRLVGRDPSEAHRAATPLELLFDLVFVVAFGEAADGLAHHLAEGHVRVGVLGFGIAMLAVSWAWGSYSWFSSAYDEDDWLSRIATAVQMLGVAIVALGLPDVFASLDHHEPLAYQLLVVGYVVMRVPMALQWLRASQHDPGRRTTLRSYAATIALAQAGWTALVVLAPPGRVAVPVAVLLAGLEVSGPLVAERRKGGTPWHAGHIAERYGLLTIISLGEGVFGTVAALSALVHGPSGWTVDAALVGVAGLGLTFAVWWMYFTVPSGSVLERHRARVLHWSYGHHLLLASIVAIGAGLHVAALALEGHTRLGATGVVLTVAVPLGVVMVVLHVQWTALARPGHALGRTFDVGLTCGGALVLAAAVGLAALGAPIAVCLVVVAVAPAVAIAGFETVGHRQLALALER
ncbi:low temperature requirement protein A [Nocardioides kongjuensis]|uniref:Low temperature requirement protein LtrA n=1 Tax=Nocardioides kongjuensis TaxID=349522 RepID=A0A852REW1_9ACTN|nr:low temperature requirement protein A [Nocardioides kongjuensis]NYD28959.1 low temperature requirement protein LtrA [Nocardioides kongjuensis]